MVRGLTQRVVDFAPPVELSITARSEVQLIARGEEVVTAPDTRVEVVFHTRRIPYPDHG